MKEFKVKRYDMGRTKKRKRTAVTTCVTVVLVALALVVGWFSYEPVYDFVTNFRFQELLPSGSQSQGESQSTPPQSTSSQAPGAEPAEPQGGFPERSAYLAAYQLEDTATLEQTLSTLKGLGVTGVVFDLKDADGVVRYRSALEQVGTNRAQAETAYDLTAAVAAVEKAGMTPIGRIYAFRDKTAPTHMYESAVKYRNEKVNWIDDSKANGGKAWLNPNNPQAQDYILALVGEAAGHGLKTVMLDGVQFPEGYALNLATYGNTGALDKSQILADFLAKARSAGESAGCQVYPTVSLMAAAGLSDIRYGDDVAKLLAASGGGVVEVMPEQFGYGVTTDKLTLSAPALAPYDTVSAVLAAAEALKGEDLRLVAMVQAYTSTWLPAVGNKTYGAAEIQEQIKAAAEGGISKVLLYNPGGSYPGDLG